ncbi:MAG: hypothetical protein IKD43_04510 [Clostridia bacterium]|nr:hypothetical protein [Clostridia bacterium]
MKKQLFWKTVFLTIGVTVILALSAFGIASLLVPAAMMDFAASIGLKGISGDYAYQEYERSGDIAYLARSFIISADLKRDRTAESRFNALYESEGFEAHCEKVGDIVVEDGEGNELARASYRGYLCGLAARMYYRLAATEEDKIAVIAFASLETEASFPQANPLIALTLEATGAEDKAFCRLILSELQTGGYRTEATDLQNIINILEGIIK